MLFSSQTSSNTSTLDPPVNSSSRINGNSNNRGNNRVVRFSQFEEQQHWEEPLKQQQPQPTSISNYNNYNMTTMMNSNNERIEIKETDMKQNMISKAMDIVREGVQKHSQDKDIASYVKDNCEKQFGPTWHCVVGRSFGSRVSYELETFALLKVNQHTVLIFKCG